jgi:hypothetical protein
MNGMGMSLQDEEEAGRCRCGGRWHAAGPRFNARTGWWDPKLFYSADFADTPKKAK